MKNHQYKTSLVWVGNKGEGTSKYRSYSRNHVITIDGKNAPILGSSDPSFLGDPTRYNPEELLLASLSSCHMLWYLHLCTKNAITVTSYQDEAKGIMFENSDGSVQFSQVILQPTVLISNADNVALAQSLHHAANKLCFIARSVNFPVKHEVTIACAGA